jgi:hypothetical protein
VDAGVLYFFVPEDCLESIGVEATVKRNLILADGRQDTRPFGFCDFEIGGLEGCIPCPVILARKGSLFLLAATTLESFGVEGWHGAGRSGMGGFLSGPSTKTQGVHYALSLFRAVKVEQEPLRWAGGERAAQWPQPDRSPSFPAS